MKKNKPPKRKKKHCMKPSTPVLVSIVNQSRKVSDAEVAAAVPAFGKQLADDVAPVWGMMPALEFVPHGETPNGNVIATLSDTPDVEGAAGYHDRDENGFAIIKVFVLDGMDWRTTMSHELLEMALDAPANRWRDAPDGADYAEELCDAVEADTYEIDGVPVSNFVYPAFFNPSANAADKLDHLERLTKPFSMTPGGYQIKRTEPGKVSQVFARHNEAAEDVHVAVHAHESKNGRSVLVVFGKDVPEAKKAGKVEKARRKYGPKVSG